MSRPSLNGPSGLPWGALLAVFLGLGALVAPRLEHPADAEAPPETPLVTGRMITPEGKHTNVGSYPANMLLS
ncbi:MAG TPA: hypothetical protein VFU47_18015, partial [Armatimonadota bacterium]|nr:hypothetical protein [Armatimonadota bacterium]